MKHLKLFEQYSTDITSVIKKLINDYFVEYKGITPYQINDGYCEQFASDIISVMGDYKDNLFELGFDNICNFRDPEFALENWTGELIKTSYGVWSKDALERFGYPPVALDIVDDEINHVWVYYDGKHYDAEAPDGVTNWIDLPLCKKFFDNYIINKL